MTHVDVWGSAVVNLTQIIILTDSFYQVKYLTLAQRKAIKMQINDERNGREDTFECYQWEKVIKYEQLYFDLIIM